VKRLLRDRCQDSFEQRPSLAVGMPTGAAGGQANTLEAGARDGRGDADQDLLPLRRQLAPDPRRAPQTCSSAALTWRIRRA
jgi:hypothetical protein